MNCAVVSFCEKLFCIVIEVACAEDDLGDTDGYEVSIYIKAEGEIDFNNFFIDSKQYTVSKGVTDEEIKKVENELGYKLPKEYIDLMKVQNGGIPIKKYFRTEKETSWGEHHICIDALYGMGDDTKSDFVIRTWEYPNAGIKGIIIEPYYSKGKCGTYYEL